MPRLIRIALTLLASASILVLLVAQRLNRLRSDLEFATGDVAEELAKQEGDMILMGMLLAGLLGCGGFILVLVEIIRRRRKATDHEG